MTVSGDPVTVLVVDDEEAIRRAVGRFLATLGHEVLTAGTGEEALAILRRHKVTGVLLDIRLPGISGIDLVPRIVELEPNAAIVMMTGVNDAATAALCLQRGALDYLTKPVDLEWLGKAIGRALQRREQRLEDQRISQWLRDEVATRAAELRAERENLERLSVATLEALVNALEAKDPFLRGHSARVADMAAAVAAELGRSDEDVEKVRTAGRLHDIGKIGIREGVLAKRGPLTSDEVAHVQQHVTIGWQILAPLAHLREMTQFVRHHHEHWDGSGYPDGLAGDRIPWGARILAAVEVYDALTTARPYQDKLLPEQAVERLTQVRHLLDPEVLRALRTVVMRRQALVFLDEPV
ncbi:MAG: response regulator [Gemmatimonadales bacterium]|nr:response regulator [Gemmatimonadales bacterium]